MSKKWTWEVAVRNDDERVTYKSFDNVAEAIFEFTKAVAKDDVLGAIVVSHPDDRRSNENIMLVFNNDWGDFIDFPDWYEG